MKQVIMVLSLVLAVASAAQAQNKPKKGPLPGAGIDWKGDFDAAIKEATARNVPILFHAGKDG